MPYNKKARKKHNIIMLTCIGISTIILAIHSAFIYSNFNTFYIVAFLIGLFIIQYLCYIVTSVGYLIFGKISGYRMMFLRIAFIKWQRDKNGKIKFSFTDEKGPASNCGMAPPEMKDGTFPHRLFGYSGVIFSSIFALISAAFLTFNFYTPIISSLLILFTLIMFMLIILDLFEGNAKRTREIKNSPLALKGMWIYGNCSVPDSPIDEYTDFPNDANINIYWIAFYGLVCGENLLGIKEYTRASEIFDKLITSDTVLTVEQYLSMIADRLFCEIMTTNESDIISKLYTDELKSFLSTHRGYSNLCRNFAFTLLIDKNPSGAAQIKAEFFEAIKNAFHPQDASIETDLLFLAEIKAGINSSL